MCIPLEGRSLSGNIHDEICAYFDKNNLCDYVLNEDFLHWVGKQDSKLRDQCEENFMDIVVIVENFAVTRNWQEKLAEHAVGGFLRLLGDHGCLDDVPTNMVFATVIAHLYFYMGILGLDRVAMMEKP